MAKKVYLFFEHCSLICLDSICIKVHSKTMPQKFSSEFNRTNFESAWENHNILEPTETYELKCGEISFLFSFQLKGRKKAVAHTAANRKRETKTWVICDDCNIPLCLRDCYKNFYSMSR